MGKNRGEKKRQTLGLLSDFHRGVILHPTTSLQDSDLSLVHLVFVSLTTDSITPSVVLVVCLQGF